MRVVVASARRRIRGRGKGGTDVVGVCGPAGEVPTPAAAGAGVVGEEVAVEDDEHDDRAGQRRQSEEDENDPMSARVVKYWQEHDRQ